MLGLQGENHALLDLPRPQGMGRRRDRGWSAAANSVWGDIDTHGFAILDRLRRHFPQVRSMLMDRATLLAHEGQWVTEQAQHVAHPGKPAA